MTNSSGAGNTEETIDERVTGIKKSWGAVFSTEAWIGDRVVQVSFTQYQLARMFIFAAGGLPEALSTLGYEVGVMEKEKAAKETPA